MRLKEAVSEERGQELFFVENSEHLHKVNYSGNYALDYLQHQKLIKAATGCYDVCDVKI